MHVMGQLKLFVRSQEMDIAFASFRSRPLKFTQQDVLNILVSFARILNPLPN